MNTPELEHALRAWLRDDDLAPDMPPPASLMTRVLAMPDLIPRRAWGAWRGSVRSDAWAMILVAALLLGLTAASILLVGALLRVWEDQRGVLTAAVEPCELLTDRDLAALFGGEWETLRGFPDEGPYWVRDWDVPEAAELVLGEGTRHCEYTGSSGGNNGHAELFARATPTTLDEAAALVGTLYGTSCAQLTAHGAFDLGFDTCSPARRELAGATTWLSTVEPDPGHFALALSLEPQLILVTMGIDGDGDEQLVVPALSTLIIDRLAGADLPVAATPRPDVVRIGDPAPGIAGPAGLRPETLEDRVVVVLSPAGVGPDDEGAIERYVMPELEAFVRAALLTDGAGLFIALAEPDVDWDSLSARLEASIGVSSLPIVLAPLEGGWDLFYLIDGLRRDEPGPSKLVVIDRQGAVAAIYPWLLPGPDELAQIVRDLAKEGR